jgi:DNA-binding transcriptional MerR regulator
MVIRIEEPETYSTKEICDMFHIAKQTLYGWEKKGIIPAVAKDWRGWRRYDKLHVEAIREIIRSRGSRMVSSPQAR